MSRPSTYEPKTGIERWLDTRLPIIRFMNDTALDFPTPKNLVVPEYAFTTDTKVKIG